jgi:HEPN domain-containing protein
LSGCKKLKGDHTSARRELRARSLPNYDDVCFHSQQLAEKYLKALLQENGCQIPYTYSLIDLLGLCLRLDPTLDVLQPDLRALEGYAVQFRYPGQKADKDEAKQAYTHAHTLRSVIRSRLGI